MLACSSPSCYSSPLYFSHPPSTPREREKGSLGLCMCLCVSAVTTWRRGVCVGGPLGRRRVSPSTFFAQQSCYPVLNHLGVRYPSCSNGEIQPRGRATSVGTFVTYDTIFWSNEHLVATEISDAPVTLDRAAGGRSSVWRDSAHPGTRLGPRLAPRYIELGSRSLEREREMRVG